jgi:hypothetical protein
MSRVEPAFVEGGVEWGAVWEDHPAESGRETPPVTETLLSTRAERTRSVRSPEQSNGARAGAYFLCQTAERGDVVWRYCAGECGGAKIKRAGNSTELMSQY